MTSIKVKNCKELLKFPLYHWSNQLINEHILLNELQYVISSCKMIPLEKTANKQKIPKVLHFGSKALSEVF